MTTEQLALLICLNAALSLFWYWRGHTTGTATANARGEITPTDCHTIAKQLAHDRIMQPDLSTPRGRLLAALLRYEAATTPHDKTAALIALHHQQKEVDQ